MAFKTLKPMKTRFLWCGYRWPLSASEVSGGALNNSRQGKSDVDLMEVDGSQHHGRSD
jgi:hypothetical protein